VTGAEHVPRDVIAIGGSAGAIEALLGLFEKLPASLPAAVLVVVHRPPLFESQLVSVLNRRSTLPVLEPRDGEPPEPGLIYLAPRDHHMRLEDGTIRLDRGPKQHRFRPAVDPLFISTAEAYGRRVIGVLLSGGGADGVRGLIAIKARGGLSIVQDPREALHPAMPAHAILEDDVDAILGLDQMADALAALTTGGSHEPASR
jgi:two-component system chemotaxis response regulator CheB